MQRQVVTGSLIGGIEETQEVLVFCAKHGIKPEIEIISIQDINEAYTMVKDKKARYRFVIDLSSFSKDDHQSADKIEAVNHILDTEKKIKIPALEVHASEDRMEFEPSWSKSNSLESHSIT